MAGPLHASGALQMGGVCKKQLGAVGTLNKVKGVTKVRGAFPPRNRRTPERRHPRSGGPQPLTSGVEASRAMGLQVKESQGRTAPGRFAPSGGGRMAVVVGRGSTCTHTCMLTDHPIKKGSFQREVF